MYKYIFFDLDGTLTDPGEGITNSVMHALAKWDIHVSDRRELYQFIGPPLLDSFARYYGFSEEECQRALVYYREYYAEKGIFENRLYDGIDDMLKHIIAAGKKVVLATSKPEEYAIKILKHFGIDEYFDRFAGSDMEEKRSRKSDVIGYALELCGHPETGEVLMVGDREHDVIGAKECGIDCAGVLYGYGSEDELRRAGAKFIVEDISQLEKIIEGF